MTIYSALVNGNKVIKQSVTTTTTGSSEDHLAVSVGPFPFHSRLKRIRVTASGSAARSLFYIVSDSAKYIAASYSPAYVTTSVDAGATFTSYSSSLNDIFHEDETRSGYIGVVVRPHSGKLTNGITLTITLEVEALEPDCLKSADYTGVAALRGFRVLRVQSDNTTTDLTRPLLGNGNPYGASLGQSFTAFAASTDKLYIGAPVQFDKLRVLVPTYARQVAGKSINVKQWSGTSWASVTTLYNNTSDHQATASGFSHSGTLCWVNRNDWTKKQITTDPAYLLQQAIDSGAEQPTNAVSCPSRFWVEISINGTPSPADLRLLSIQPLDDPCD